MGFEPDVALSEIPDDAEFEGHGPLFTWDGERRRWVDYDLANFRKMTPQLNGPAPDAAAAWEHVARLNIELREAADRMRGLLEFAGTPMRCPKCDAKVYRIAAITGTRAFNENGAMHALTCASVPAAEDSLFAEKVVNGD
jgi:hypothetical protein